MLNKRKIRKLVKSPKLFVKDALKKRNISLIRKKIKGQNKFTVVSAVYGVEKYLDDYFKSLTKQTLKFEDHIYLILVDDGSPDNSAKIIKKWQKKYPNNILYLKKENGGQASARNLGLDYVKTEWVTFIDPDDFVSLNYFEEIDKFLTKHKDIALISTNFIFYYEDKKTFSDTHPLKYRFKKDINIVEKFNMQDSLQISVNSAFFRYSDIQRNNIRFKDIRPSLEDGEFTMRYLLYSNYKKVVFLKEPKYYYRKRASGDSTLDKSWTNPKAFDDVLQLACLDLFKESLKTVGFVPKEQQKMVLYHLIWQFKRIINNPQSVSFLNDEQIKKYKILLKEIFKYIDKEEIEKFNLAGAWFYHKVGLLGMLKNEDLDYQIVYIENYDPTKKEVLLRYFSYFDSDFIVTIDNKEVLPSHFKIRRHEFLGDKFVDEYRIWLPINKGKINIFIDNKITKINFQGRLWSDGIDINLIESFFETKPLDDSKFPLKIRLKRKVLQKDYYINKFKNAWLLMDRDIQADDNAEHLYRYIQKNHPDVNIFYVLRRSSRDWDRLKKEGFNLIEYGSLDHQALFVHAKHLISSHADGYIVDFMPKKYFKDIIKFKFTFLQHGITQNDLSNWLNTKNIDNFITTSKAEYNSIAGNYTKYKFTSKEVSLTGFPRHDNLLKNKNKKEKIILIMPTWRQSLVGATVGKSARRKKINNFHQSQYAKAWKSLLQSEKLKFLVQKYGYKIIFYPHINIQPYLDEFNIPDYIEMGLQNKGSIQELFQKASLMITDYSSVAFEMGLLQREVIYYQFDYDEVFNKGNHTIGKGYFSYENDGFGPVCYEEDEVLEELERFFSSGGKIEEKYLKRMKEFFEYHDTNNSKRVFESIKNLEKFESKEVDENVLINLINEAYEKKMYKALESRCEKYLKLKDDIEVRKKLLLAKCYLGHLEYVENELKKIDFNTDVTDIQKLLNKYKALFDKLDQKEKKLLVSDEYDLFVTLRFEKLKDLFNKSKWKVLNVAFKLIDINNIRESQKSEFFYMWGKTLKMLGNSKEAIEKFAKSLEISSLNKNALFEFSSTLFEIYKPDHLNKNVIKSYFENSNIIIPFELIEKWFNEKLYQQVSILCDLVSDIDKDYLESFYYICFKSCKESKRYKDALQYQDKIKRFIQNNNLLKKFKKDMAEILEGLNKWEEALTIWYELEKDSFIDSELDYIYGKIVLCLYNLNKKDELDNYKKIILNRGINRELLSSSIDLIKIHNACNL